VATDVAARGIDVEGVTHVVNVACPEDEKTYLHRIGRTGRAGASGEAISLVCVDEEGFLRDIEKLIGRHIERTFVRGFEPDPKAVAQPIQVGRRTLNGSGRSSQPRRDGPPRRPQGERGRPVRRPDAGRRPQQR